MSAVEQLADLDRRIDSGIDVDAAEYQVVRAAAEIEERIERARQINAHAMARRNARQARAAAVEALATDLDVRLVELRGAVEAIAGADGVLEDPSCHTAAKWAQAAMRDAELVAKRIRHEIGHSQCGDTFGTCQWCTWVPGDPRAVAFDFAAKAHQVREYLVPIESHYAHPWRPDPAGVRGHLADVHRYVDALRSLVHPLLSEDLQ
ncbi:MULTISPECIES: hypothetical protein [unclassified Gordonia (in: high G+C Gram-positive bacteria)]